MGARKLIVTIISIMIVSIDCHCESSFYYGFDDKINIKLLSHKIALCLNEDSKRVIDSLLLVHKIKASWKNSKLCVIDDIRQETLQQIKTSIYNSHINSVYMPVYSINNKLEAVLYPEIVLHPQNISFNLDGIVIRDGKKYVQ